MRLSNEAQRLADLAEAGLPPTLFGIPVMIANRGEIPVEAADRFLRSKPLRRRDLTRIRKQAIASEKAASVPYRWSWDDYSDFDAE